MKKLLFTALAVLAFSGASFAKTGEVDDTFELKSISVVFEPESPGPTESGPSTYCNVLGVLVSLEAEALGIDHTTALYIGSRTIAACNKLGY